MAGYLFVHFIGEQKDGEQIYFSLSKDGLYWKDLNDGKPVLFSHIGEKGVRDPFPIKDEKTGKYYIIATDLRIEAGKGWSAAQREGSLDLIVWESEDLIHWSHERSHHVGIEGAGCVWAPEAIYDEEKEAFLVFFASRTQTAGECHSKHKIYAVYTQDFKTFSEPFIYIERDKDVIDTTIVQHKGYYYRFSKDETTSRIKVDFSHSLTGSFTEISSETLEQMAGVEGPECFLLPDRKRWCLIVDRFAEGKGYLPLVTEDLQSGEWEILTDEMYDLGRTKKRHGGVLKLTDEEYERMRKTFGGQNPILEGLYADPDIAVFNDKYYIYPTTDGYKGWAGTQFSVFSSEDGINFKNEGQILDVATNQVPWAIGSAWAPCIAHKNEKYYFYFCAKQVSGVSAIGVAVANSPVGPFVAEEKPLLTMDMMREYGITMGQTIDPSIYMEDGRYWILFGNGHAAIAELKEDMIHIYKESLRNIEGAKDFREAITVLRRGDIYHFTWSCDDTGSENYHVNYGISKSLYGPIQYQYTILEKHPEQDILGTGHHAIVKLLDRDEYQIAYHRFATPLAKYPKGSKGYYREVCIAPLTFGEDGLMQRVVHID